MIHIIVIGRVQGVGFRQFIKSSAIKLNIKGWVKNLPDRSVEAMFTGSTDNLKKMIEKCRKGPFLAEVKDIKIEDLEDQEFEDFKIIT